jgi:hypothetical protein
MKAGRLNLFTPLCRASNTLAIRISSTPGKEIIVLAEGADFYLQS